MLKPMVLTGDGNVPVMPTTDAQVNHLRRLLAWMCCEYMLDEDMQRGYLQGLQMCAAHGLADDERASELLAEKAEQINRVPIYVRQAVKMLTKALREHDKTSGIVEQ